MVSQKNGQNPRFGLSVRDIVVKGLRAPKPSFSQEISRAFDFSHTQTGAGKAPRVTGVRGLKRQVPGDEGGTKRAPLWKRLASQPGLGNQVRVAFAMLISTKTAETEPSRVRASNDDR